MLKDFVLLGIVLIFAALILRIFPDKIDAVKTESRKYFMEMMMILPAVMMITALFSLWVSRDTVEKYLGKASGIRGIFLAVFFGALPTGPLYVAFPVAATLLKKGARIANVIIFLSAWACIKIPQEMVELQFLGLKFMALRLILTILFALIMGLIIEYIIERSAKNITETKQQKGPEHADI